MIIKFEKIDNNYCVVIPQEILNTLNMHENTKLFVRTDGKNIILEPIDSTKSSISNNPKLQKIYENFVEKHEETLKKLAE